VGLDAKGSIPHILFAAYQATFCVITAALISGAVVERMRFGPYVAFITLWSVVVYAPIAHWVWGGAGSVSSGLSISAGGTVVHINAAAAALVAAVVLGARRITHDRQSFRRMCRFTLLGAGLLWFGWFGFKRWERAGSEWIGGARLLQHDVRSMGTLVCGASSTSRAQRRQPQSEQRPPCSRPVAITSGGGFCKPGIRNRAWSNRGCSELLRHSLESGYQARRFTRRDCGAWGRRNGRCVAYWRPRAKNSGTERPTARSSAILGSSVSRSWQYSPPLFIALLERS